MLLLILFSILSDRKSVEVKYKEEAPVIDGYIEEIWQKADSAYDFIQFMPYEKTKPSEKTVVYVLQDEENLYIAFRCYSDSIKPVSCLTADEDDVRFFIDTFGSNTTGYFFQVYGSGIKFDGWALDDGRTYDDSWEGVWYRGIKFYEDRYEVEFKIPFKSIRYKKGLNTWRVAFARYMAGNQEVDVWNEHLQKDDVLISKSGYMTGINPGSKGYHFELYPEGYLRYDEDETTGESELKPRLSLNFKWDITPAATINATAYPDFAQIESDPFTLNLSRYPTYLGERRPFFLEGQDIFRLSDFGGWGFFDPLEIFYSRKIGKSVNDDAIPIIGGVKFTTKSEKLNIGALTAYTDEYQDTLKNIDEPERGFGVLRVKSKVLKNSNVGLLLSGTMADRDEYNYAVGLDGVYRKGVTQFIIQGALSDKNGKYGYAVNTGYFGHIGNFINFVSAHFIDDSFDVSNVGFVPWAGRNYVSIASGPYREFSKGFMRNFFITPGIRFIKEPGNHNWSIAGKAEFNAHFRNNWGLDFNIGAGKYYEVDTSYFQRYINLSVWGRLLGNHIDFGGYYEYCYNYNRGFLAYQGSNWFSYRYSIIPQLSFSLNSNLWIEWDENNKILAMWPRIRPQLHLRFNADMSLTLFNEIVTKTPGTDLGELDLLSNRFGLLYSWNFSPKSWIYIALNDHRARNENEIIQPVYRISAVKAKYLIYF